MKEYGDCDFCENSIVEWKKCITFAVDLITIKIMANFVLEVEFEEGRTNCEDCPFRTDNGCCDIPTEHKLDCDKYDLTTIKLRKNIGEIKLNF